MSFSALIKNELLDGKPLRGRFKRAFAYGLFAFSKDFSGVVTESPGVVKVFEDALRLVLGQDTRVNVKEQSRAGRELYSVRLAELSDQNRLRKAFGYTENGLNTQLLQTQEQAAAFVGGAYLVCGNTTDPQKSYHVEFTVKEHAPGMALKELLETYLPGAKTALRRGSLVVYYKEYAQVEDLLAFIGAPKACLAMIDVEIMKSLRNTANRATNCETANIDKLVRASATQLEDIGLVLSSCGETGLPEHLLAAAKLRLDNPEASIRELAKMAEPRVSRSGLFHRLDRLSKMAGQIREKAGKAK